VGTDRIGVRDYLPTNSQVSAIVAGQTSANAGFSVQAQGRGNPYMSQQEQQQQTVAESQVRGENNA